MVFIFSPFWLYCLPGQWTTVWWLKGEARPQCVSRALVVASLDLAIAGPLWVQVLGGGQLRKSLLLIIW